MIDPYGRTISYLRVSVTDRCDFRCLYCMSEDMSFLAKTELLTLEELERICAAFIRLGVKKLRFTGGEPLVRRGVVRMMAKVGQYLGHGLEELTLTTNGSQLAANAAGLKAAGMARINVSLDTLDEQKFAQITRWGRLPQVLEGIAAAKAAGLAIKINMVVLKGVNENEVSPMLAWCGENGFDLCLIETMPMGDIAHRAETYQPLEEIRHRLGRDWTLLPSLHSTNGPARYWQVEETGQRLGLITPLSEHFCASCNRVRLTCTGKLFMCLGQDDEADLRAPLRASESDALLEAEIHAAIARKPKAHDFEISRPAVARHMSVTGG